MGSTTVLEESTQVLLCWRLETCNVPALRVGRSICCCVLVSFCKRARLCPVCASLYSLLAADLQHDAVLQNTFITKVDEVDACHISTAVYSNERSFPLHEQRIASRSVVLLLFIVRLCWGRSDRAQTVGLQGFPNSQQVVYTLDREPVHPFNQCNSPLDRSKVPSMM
jgi:hypothetical protein